MHNQDGCSAHLRLNFGEEHQRENGSLAFESYGTKFLHGIETSEHSPHVDLRQLLRGDEAVPGSVSRLCYNGALVVKGISFEELESDSDTYFNSIIKPPLVSVVKALTVDGVGGTINWRANNFSACLAYYLENFFIRVPFVELERITREVQNINRTVTERTLLRPQVEAFQAWYRNYLTEVATCPTHRPITEGYFMQLRAQGLPSGEERELGEAFFSDFTYEVLKSKEREIMWRAQSA